MSASLTRRGAEPHDPRRGRWIPWVFVGGMLTVVAVNAVLVVASISTFSGVTVGRAYERGRQYDQVLAEAARQDALGWRAEVSATGTMLQVAALDRDGRPVAGRMDGVLLRPLEGTTQPLEFAAVAPGRWVAAIPAPRPGQWEARLTLTGPEERHFDIRRRLVLP
jgi:nitrogen fixation protein FixH